MGAPVRMTPEDRGEGFEREGERHMNGKVGNDPGARERRRSGRWKEARVRKGSRIGTT